VRLIVIDSITAPSWTAGVPQGDVTGGVGTGTGSMAQERTVLLAQQAGSLKQLADTFAIPILVTNQVGAAER
jgi:RecA/RadA recombinase